MIDALPRTHLPLFADTTPRKLPRSFYWGAGFALLLHAGLIYYLVAHNFTQAVVDTPPISDPTVTVSMDQPQPPKPAPPPPPTNHVVVHQTPEPPIATKPLELPAQPPNTGPTTTEPPKVLTQPALPPTGAGTSVETGAGTAPVAPRWKAFPNSDALSQYYPPRAIDSETEGTASVQCTVLDTAGHVHCTVIAESPKGYGFGDATRRMVEDKGRVDTSTGDIRVGSLLSITTVKWQLN